MFYFTFAFIIEIKDRIMNEISNKAVRMKQQYREAILSDAKLHGEVASAVNKSLNSVYRWCKNNSEDLTMIAALNVVKNYLNVPSTDDLLEEITLEQAA
jgi:hypothetical protein